MREENVWYTTNAENQREESTMEGEHHGRRTDLCDNSGDQPGRKGQRVLLPRLDWVRDQHEGQQQDLSASGVSGSLQQDLPTHKDEAAQKREKGAQRVRNSRESARDVANYISLHHGVQIEATGDWDSVPKVLAAAKQRAEGKLDYLNPDALKTKAQAFKAKGDGYVSDHQAEPQKKTENAERKQKSRESARDVASYLTKHHHVQIEATGDWDSAPKVLAAAKQRAKEKLDYLNPKALRRKAQAFKAKGDGYVSDHQAEPQKKPKMRRKSKSRVKKQKMRQAISLGIIMYRSKQQVIWIQSPRC